MENSEAKLSSHFSPHLDILPKKLPEVFSEAEEISWLDSNPAGFARLLVHAHRKHTNSVELAARVARRTLEVLEHELSSPTLDSFIDACCSGEIQHVEKYLSGDNPIVDGFHSTLGYTALHGACLFNHLKIVKLLLDVGADIHAEQKADKATPLHLAAEHGNSTIVAHLLHNTHADKFRINSEGWTAFGLAKDGGHTATAALLSTEPSKVVEINCRCEEAAPRECYLSWEAPNDHGTVIDGYEIGLTPLSGTEVEQFPARAEAEIFIPSGPSPFKELTHLFPATTYQVKLRAHNAAGWSEVSRATCFTTPSTFPSKAHTPTLANTGTLAFSVDLEWPQPDMNNGEIIIEYDVQYREVNYSQSEELARGSLESKDENEGKSVGEIQHAEMKEAEGIVKDSGPRMAKDFSYIGEWESSGQAPGKELVIEERESGRYKKEVQFSRIFYTAENLSPECFYQFRTRAQNAIGWSTFSEASAPMRTKANAKIVQRSARSMTLEWEESVNKAVHCKLLSWEIEASVPPSAHQEAHAYDCRKCEWRVVDDNVDPAWTSYTLHHLAPATMYYFRITPRFLLLGGREVKPWHRQAVTCGECTLAAPPEPPPAPKVLDEDHESATLLLTLPCDNGEAVQEMQLRQCTVHTGVWSLLGIFIDATGKNEGVTFEQKVAGLDAGKEYLFAARARNSNGWSRFSTISLASRTRTLPKPSTPRLIQRSSESFQIEWIRQESQRFVVEMKKVASEGSELEAEEVQWVVVAEEEGLGRNVCLIMDLLPVSSYVFRVKIQAKDGDWSQYSHAAGPFTTLRRF